MMPEAHPTGYADIAGNCSNLETRSRNGPPGAAGSIEGGQRATQLARETKQRMHSRRATILLE
jgi:hypothetical protein